MTPSSTVVSCPRETASFPHDFGERLIRLKEAADVTWDELSELLGVEPKQALRWTDGTKPSGGSYHSLVRLAPWIPGGLDILLGDDFLDPLKED